MRRLKSATGLDGRWMAGLPTCTLGLSRGRACIQAECHRAWRLAFHVKHPLRCRRVSEDFCRTESSVPTSLESGTGRAGASPSEPAALDLDGSLVHPRLGPGIAGFPWVLHIVRAMGEEAFPWKVCQIGGEGRSTPIPRIHQEGGVFGRHR